MQSERMLERIYGRPFEGLLREKIDEWGGRPGLVTGLAAYFEVSHPTIYKLMDKYGLETPEQKAQKTVT